MENSNLKSLTGQVQLLHKTDKDFPHKLKQRIVLESSNNVTNHFELIVHLFNEGALCDGSYDSEGTVGLKEMMVQLALMIACSKGSDAIGSLMNALEASGNSQLISSLGTWLKQDLGIETDAELSEPTRGASAMLTALSENVPKNMKTSYELNPTGIKLIDKIMSHVEGDFMEQLESHLVGKASQVHNFREICSSLVNQKVLEEADIQLSEGVQDGQRIEKLIQSACSKKAIGSLVIALQRSDNERILEETYEWLETLQARKKNDPIAVKSLADQPMKEESKAVHSIADGLEKFGTFNCETKSCTKGPLALKFNQDKLIALLAEGTVKLWNWPTNEEKTIKLRVNVKDVTCFQYDKEVFVLGTAGGTVYLFDAKTREEKWSIRLEGPVSFLQFVESSLAIVVCVADGAQFWWVDISRSGMQLCNRRLAREYYRGGENSGFVMEPDRTFLYCAHWVNIHDTKSGNICRDKTSYGNYPCSLEAPADINTLNVVDLISSKRYVVAGCKNGIIALWSTGRFIGEQKPTKKFQGHSEAIVSMCAVSGHLLSLDQSQKLFMWSGYDLESKEVALPVPRVLAQSFLNVTSLVSHDRWFASCSSADGIINIWVLPELWLRTG